MLHRKAYRPQLPTSMQIIVSRLSISLRTPTQSLPPGNLLSRTTPMQPYRNSLSGAPVCPTHSLTILPQQPPQSFMDMLPQPFPSGHPARLQKHFSATQVQYFRHVLDNGSPYLCFCFSILGLSIGCHISITRAASHLSRHTICLCVSICLIEILLFSIVGIPATRLS